MPRGTARVPGDPGRGCGGCCSVTTPSPPLFFRMVTTFLRIVLTSRSSDELHENSDWIVSMIFETFGELRLTPLTEALE